MLKTETKQIYDEQQEHNIHHIPVPSEHLETLSYVHGEGVLSSTL